MAKKDQNNEGGSTGYQAETINVYNGKTPHNRSIIAEIVNILSNGSMLENSSVNSTALPAGVEEKIRHNNLISCRHIIETYKDNAIDLTKAYRVLEEAKPGRQQKILHMISVCYKKQLAQLFDEGDESNEKIKEKSDLIFENIMKSLREKILESSNLDADNEDVDIAIGVIMADAFIECVVLENPGGSA